MMIVIVLNLKYLLTLAKFDIRSEVPSKRGFFARYVLGVGAKNLVWEPGDSPKKFYNRY